MNNFGNRQNTTWMRLKGCRTWCSNPKHGPFLRAGLDGERARITFTCEGDGRAVQSFLQTILGRRLERAHEDFSRKGGKVQSLYSELNYEVIEEEN